MVNQMGYKHNLFTPRWNRHPCRNPELPYGYWISPNGEAIPVFRDHMETIAQFGEGQSDWEEVLYKGWIRIVNGRRLFIVEAAPEFVHKRWSTIRDLAIESGCPEMIIDTPDHRWTELNINDLDGPPSLRYPQFRPLVIANPEGQVIKIFDKDLDYEFVLNVVRGKNFNTEGTYEVYHEGQLIGRIFRDTLQFSYAIWYDEKGTWLGNTKNEAVKRLLNNYLIRR